MCGICGLWGKADRSIVEKMLDTIKHRGPDDTGIFYNNHFSFGMNRLSILDTSLSGHQPMQNSTGKIHLIYNGEMYNFIEEKQLLEKEGFIFKSSSDTEVILYLYEKYGIEGIKRIRGMFSIAIYDARDKNPSLILARDSMGIKPLYYHYKNGIFVFASEIKAILASGVVERQINKEALRQFIMNGSVQQPLTMLQNVHMLLPGYFLVLKDTINIKKYSNPIKIDPGLSTMEYKTQVEYLEDIIEKSVKLQLRSDVPFGAFLSGGIDSSLIVALMQKNLMKKVNTFSVGFSDVDNHQDETNEAQITADFLGTKHKKVITTGKNFKEDFFHIVWSMDQPSIDGINSYYVSKAASEDLTVALSGTGGDELFAGYPWFVNMLKWYQDKDSFSVKENIKRLMGKRQKETFLERFSKEYYINNSNEYESTVCEDWKSEENWTESSVYNAIDIMDGYGPVNRVTALCVNGYMRNQLLRDIDVMSMAHNLEVRVPLVDEKVLNAALSLPDDSKIYGDFQKYNPYSGTYKELGTKRILIDIGKKYLPKDFEVQPKRGFSMPFSKWMREDVNEHFSEALSEKSITNRGIFNYKNVLDIKTKFSNGLLPWSKIWSFVLFEYWCREFLDT